ncbi:hypothetical protein D9M68_584140 [compost metagenome]
MAFTAPHEAAVVTAAKRAEASMPKRTSLPSMLPPLCSALATWSTPSGPSSGLPACSAGVTASTATTNSTVIAASTAQPWRRSPTTRPKAKHSAAGIRKIASISSRLLNAVGFS